MHIYLLSSFLNQNNIEDNTYETEHESKVSFSKNKIKLELLETNSLIEERYCLRMMSSKYIIEGHMSYNEIKESMIHHHPTGHPWKHLQFKLPIKGSVIRINLEPIDENDYIKCIKGFIYLSQELIKIEQEDNNIKENLTKYFFNDNILTLKPYKNYLLNKIRIAHKSGNILNTHNNSINNNELEFLKNDKRLLTFLNW